MSEIKILKGRLVNLNLLFGRTYLLELLELLQDVRVYKVSNVVSLPHLWNVIVPVKCRLAR